MTRKIFKYSLGITDEQTIEMPRGAKPLYVGVKDENLCLWVEVQEAADQVPYTLYVVGTGNPMPKDTGRYIGSAVGGPFVWHVYEKAQPDWSNPVCQTCNGTRTVRMLVAKQRSGSFGHDETVVTTEFVTCGDCY